MRRRIKALISDELASPSQSRSTLMNTSQRRTRVWPCLVIASLLAGAAWADGELDTTFGSNGAVRVTFPNSSLGYLYDTAVVNGALEAAGFERVDPTTGCTTQFPNLFIVQLSLAGTVSGSPRSYAQQAVECPAGLVIDSANGDIYVAGSSAVPGGGRATVTRFNASGAVISTYTDPSEPSNTSTLCLGAKPLLDSRNRFVAPCLRLGEFGYRQLAALRLLTEANQLVADVTFGSNGFSLVGTTSGYFIRSSNAVAQDANSGAYYLGGYACSQGGGSACLEGLTGADRAQYVIRLGAASGLDTSYGNGGVAIAFSALDGDVQGVAVDDSGNVVVGGGYGGMNSGYVARLTPTGTPDATFGTNSVVQNIGDRIIDVRTDAMGRVYPLGTSSHLLRLKVDGTRDASFAASSDVQVLNGPGSAWQSVRFVDSTQSSVYLVGGAVGCASCSNAATTAIIAKVDVITGPRMTVTRLISSATTVSSGQSATFTATVAGTSPTGTVTFKDGQAMLGSPVNLNSGSASYTTVALAVGSHSITAAYSGDGNNAASTSTPVVESVNPSVTKTTITSSAPTITSGQSVTFTATVAGTSPTGTVTFKDGSTMLGNPVNLNSGNASYSTAALAVGSHHLTANYSGDSNNASSASTAVTETVNPVANSGGGTSGGGSFQLMDLCALFLLALWRVIASGGAVQSHLNSLLIQRQIRSRNQATRIG